MAVHIRLRRFGKKNRPLFRICAIEAGRARDAEYIESIGHYDPYIADDSKKVHINRERAEYWLGVGAQVSETVKSFFRRAQVSGFVRPKKRSHRRPKKARPVVRPAATATSAERSSAKPAKPAKPAKAAKSPESPEKHVK